MPPASLLDLMEHHRRLDALLLAHQEALLGLDLDRAKERLEVYTRALLAHMKHEDENVLPRYSELPRVRGGGVELFSGEHQRLRELLAEVQERVQALTPESPTLRRDAIGVFDRTALLKGLLEHHDLREGQLLYPRLDAALGDDEKRAILEGAPEPP